MKTYARTLSQTRPLILLSWIKMSRLQHKKRVLRLLEEARITDPTLPTFEWFDFILLKRDLIAIYCASADAACSNGSLHSKFLKFPCSQKELIIHYYAFLRITAHIIWISFLPLKNLVRNGSTYGSLPLPHPLLSLLSEHFTTHYSCFYCTRAIVFLAHRFGRSFHWSNW